MQENITSTLTTPRKPIKKLTQFTEKEKSHFLELFNTQSFTVTEKIDGMALRLFFDKEKMLFESAYSGLVEKDDFTFNEISNELYEKCTIKNIFEYPIKLVGELVYNAGIEIENNIKTFAPVCTKYSPSLSVNGSYFVIFNMFKVENNNLIQISDDEYNKIISMILHKSNTSDLVQYVDGRKLTYDFSDIDTDTFDALKSAFEYKVDSLKSNLCYDNVNSPIEGIVITFKNGEQFGVFSSKYKEIKNQYYEHLKEAEYIENVFKKNVYGYCRNCSIIEHKTYLYDDAKRKYDYYKNITIDNLKLTFYSIKTNKLIPFSCKYFQLKRVLNIMNKILINDEISYIIG